MVHRTLRCRWRLLSFAVLAVSMLLSGAVALSQRSPTIPWRDASTFVGRTVTADGPVVCPGYSDGIG